MLSSITKVSRRLRVRLGHLISITLLLTPWALSAEPMPIPEPAAAASREVDALAAPTVDEWVTEEVTSQGLLDAIDRTRSEVAGQPYHQRAPTWVQNVTAAQDADARRMEEDATRAQRDRATVAWLLADDAERQQASAAIGGEAPSPAALDMETGATWQRGVVIPLLLALMVSAGLTWLVRRPKRGAKSDSQQPDEAPATGSRRRRRSRRHRVADPGR